MALVSGAFFFDWAVGAASTLTVLAAAAVSFLVLHNYWKWKQMQAIPEIKPWYPILGNSLILDRDAEGKNFPPTSSKGASCKGGGSGYNLPLSAYSVQLVSGGGRGQGAEASAELLGKGR